MKLLIRDISAIELWDKGLGSRVRPVRSDELHGLTLNAEERAAINPREFGVSSPIQLLSIEDEFHGRALNWDYLYWSRPLPEASVVCAADGIYVATPEFCFLRMAPKLGLYDSLKLGMEMCGGYSTLVPPGCKYRDRPPITTKEKLLHYLEKALPTGSKSVALKAARLIRAGSASPGETASYLELCLPYRYGWFGFVAPKLNAVIPLEPEERRACSRMELRVDMYWEGFGLAGEYLGKEDHEGEFNVQRDVIRDNVLEAKGIEVVRISHAMLMNPEQMMVAVERIAKRMNRRMRIPEQGFWEKQEEARAQIMRDGRCSWVH